MCGGRESGLGWKSYWTKALCCRYVCCSEGQADCTESLDGRIFREVAESDLAGGWTETGGPVKHQGPHKETSEAS